VQIGAGPPLLPHPFALNEGKPHWPRCATALLQQDGKAVDGGGKPGDLPEYSGRRFRGRR